MQKAMMIGGALLAASITAAQAQYGLGNNNRGYGSGLGGYGTGSNPNSSYVDPHYNKNGSYVPGHYRTNPNNTTRDNYGTSGNYKRQLQSAHWTVRHQEARLVVRTADRISSTDFSARFRVRSGIRVRKKYLCLWQRRAWLRRVCARRRPSGRVFCDRKFKWHRLIKVC
jgi:hypothetical protein